MTRYHIRLGEYYLGQDNRFTLDRSRAMVISDKASARRIADGYGAEAVPVGFS